MDMTSDSYRNANHFTQNAERLISVSEVVQIIRQHWILGAFFGLVVGVIVIVGLLMIPPVYRAKASLLVELGTENIMDVQEVLDSSIKNHSLLASFMNTHIERLKSRTIADQVFHALDPDMQEKFYEGYLGPLEEFEGELPDVASLMTENALKVTWETESQAIQIEVSHADPAVAQDVANTYIKVYMRYKANLREKSNSGAVLFLSEQIEEIREELESNEQALQDFRLNHSLVSLEAGRGIVSQKLAQVNEAVTDARIRLLSIANQIKQVEKESEDLDQLMGISFVGGRRDVKAIYAQLQELRREFKVLDGVYLSRHPLIVENKASQQSVLESLWQAIDQARREIRVDYETTEGELKSLMERLESTERESLAMEGHLIEYRVMERNVEVLRQTYDMLSTRYTQTSIAQRMNLSNVHILDVATMPSDPAWPNQNKIAFAAIFISGIFFVGVPLSFEFFDSRIKNFSDIEHYANTPLLGDLRFYPHKSEEDLGKAVILQDQDLREPFRAIFGSLRMKMSFDKKPITLLVTSSVPGEGKSFVAANLAATFASHKLKVLLVDCDLRRATLHSFYGLENKSGILQWVADSTAVLTDKEQPALHTELDIRGVAPNLFLLSSGGSCEHATEILEDRRFRNLMKALHSSYDVIIFDTPPVGLFPDATLVADYASATLFVARQHQVSRPKLRYAVNVMGRSSAPVIGAVLNGIKDISSVVGHGSLDSGYYGYGFDKDTTRYQAYYKKKARKKAS